jgi:hypothetical protein
MKSVLVNIWWLVTIVSIISFALLRSRRLAGTADNVAVGEECDVIGEKTLCYMLSA